MKKDSVVMEMMRRAGRSTAAGYYQYLSDRYVAKAAVAETVEEKKALYNKVLYYSGMKAVVEG